MSKSLHTISLFVANKPGVLLRVTITFARRGFNIESLVVSPAFDGQYSRMTITAFGNDKDLSQIVKQLSKLVDVISAKDNRNESSVEREMALIKVDTELKKHQKLLQVIDNYQANIINQSKSVTIIEISGESKKITEFIEQIKPFNCKELVRSGKMVMQKELSKEL